MSRKKPIKNLRRYLTEARADYVRRRTAGLMTFTATRRDISDPTVRLIFEDRARELALLEWQKIQAHLFTATPLPRDPFLSECLGAFLRGAPLPIKGGGPGATLHSEVKSPDRIKVGATSGDVERPATDNRGAGK